MAEQGWNFPNVDAERDFATKVKQQYHRPNLTFQPEGLVFTMNKADQEKDADYSPLTFTASLSVAANMGDTAVTLSSVWGITNSRTVTITEGMTSEDKVVRSVNPATRQVTFTSPLANSWSTLATASQDRVTVSYADKVTTVDIVTAGENAVAALAGSDVQYGIAYAGGNGFNDLDSCQAMIYVPYWVGSWIQVFAAWLCRGIYVVEGQRQIELNSYESAFAVDPNYIMRLKFISQEDTPTQKKVSVLFGKWRA